MSNENHDGKSQTEHTEGRVIVSRIRARMPGSDGICAVRGCNDPATRMRAGIGYCGLHNYEAEQFFGYKAPQRDVR